ncbi:MAG: ABC transporter permease [Cytophagales bacterium]|nr:ABC transporter permease [Cytophagales bacterium]
MKTVIDINYLELALGSALMLIPIFILWYYKTKLVQDTIIAVIRMAVQLLLIGLYLEYIFTLNNPFVNIAWVLVMAIIASTTIIKRSGLKTKMFFVPILLSLLVSIFITDTYFLGFVIKLENTFDARYFVPITGMLLGNIIKNIIMGLDVFYQRLYEEQNLYQWHLANGANKKEALLPFMQEALKKAFNPLIATTAIMGLISLPGMMTGQILGGSNPNIAVKYQIMLLVTIFTSATLTVVLSILFSSRSAFDRYGNLKHEIFRNS